MSGAVLFLGGAAIVLFGPRGEPYTAERIGLAVIIAGVACLAIGAWRTWTRVDWKRIDAEQRLWESGPIGRAWLRIRQILMGKH